MPARLREPVPGGCRPVAERRMPRVRWRCWCVNLLAIFVLCVQSLAAVMPALGDAHHHEPGLPHDRLHGPRAEPAMPPLMHGSAVATGSNEVEVPSAQPHRHAAVERHHHGSPADPHDRMALDDTLEVARQARLLVTQRHERRRIEQRRRGRAVRHAEGVARHPLALAEPPLVGAREPKVSLQIPGSVRA